MAAHGKASTYKRLGCRCDPCREAISAYYARGRARFAERPMSRVSHGETAYSRGCRCSTCKQARAEYQRRLRARNRHAERVAAAADGRTVIESASHGHSGYKAGCRCDVCLAAGRSQDALRRATSSRTTGCVVAEPLAPFVPADEAFPEVTDG